MIDYSLLRKQVVFLNALCAAHDAVEAGKELKPAEAVDLDAAKTAARNAALAGDGLKAALLGTLSTLPTATAKTLTDTGMDEKLADDIIAEVVVIRADALALKPIGVK
jgi:hypothetical protein